MEQNNKNQNTALLVMDVQSATVKMLKDDMYFINSITKAIQTARKSKMPVIYVIVGFRKGYPEVSPNNKSFSVLKNRTIHFDTEEAAKVYMSIEPKPGD
jgi:Amidases related to nicotinamidase